DDDSASDRLARRSRDLAELAELHPGIAEFVRSADAASAALDDAIRSLREVGDELERDPSDLQVARDRLDRLVELEERYRRTADDLVRYRDEVRTELDSIVDDEARVPQRRRELDAALVDLEKSARSLTRRRRAAAKKLASEVRSGLGELGMEKAVLEVCIESLEASEPETASAVVEAADPMIESEGGGPATAGGAASRLLSRFDLRGADRVEFEFGPNPGEPLGPLRRIASGGELSRVMLALESVLASVGRVPILVFDEIDTGVGGRLGTEIGRKLGELGRHHQVFCVTHLPQVASFGRSHFHVDKEVTRGRTKTSVKALDGEARERELAAMIRGSADSETSRTEAREMLQHALRTQDD
ncbi:MAG: hypothetical protein KDC38_02795, partial [Planctomycetes bacterium]|nr:hypothetical protein [Planctomycetota bacterium]